ncbi:DEAD/DEAH box helicase [Olivibacter sitiensis]|uniref:DEAD/DEAH box helicase n=1 Tax=Olivibacter sitiensis TaxID=376470 RepID=UPI00042539A1|nr:DEAD/DEAH box helicase [Olivibacter sitiensis]
MAIDETGPTEGAGPYHEVLMEGISIAQLSEPRLYQYALPDLAIPPTAYQHIVAIDLSVNKGAFGNRLGGLTFPQVELEQSTLGLKVCSMASGEAGKLTEEEATVLMAVIKRVEFRAFFDDMLREQLLRKRAVDYGMENEANLQDFFQIAYQEGELHISPKLSALLSMDKQGIDVLQQWLAPDDRAAVLPVVNDKEHKTIVVLRQHKYYRHLLVELYEAPQTKEGGLKNPFRPIEPLSRVWGMKEPKEVKFFSAIHRFQQAIVDKNLSDQLVALRALVLNPLGYPFYYHDASVSEKVHAASVKAVQVVRLPQSATLKVAHKAPFYELSATILLDGSLHSLHGVQLKYDYFLMANESLYLVDNRHLLGLIQLFRDKSSNILIHQNKYPQLKKEVLAKLEEQVDVKYEYAHAATASQMELFGRDIEKLIYLEDVGDYVAITPVLRYGEAEVSLRAKTQLHGIDEKGNSFMVPRDGALETEFMAQIIRQHPFFEEQLDNQLDYLYLHRKRFLDEDWFPKVFEQWFSDGITVLGFKDLQGNRYNPNPVKIHIRILSGIDWFNAEVDVRFGKAKASLRQLRATLRDRRKYVRLDDGTLGILPEEWIVRFNTYFNIGEILDDDTLGIAKTNFMLVQELFDAEMLDEETKWHIQEYVEKLSSTDALQEAVVPKGLQAQLRPYQKQGLAWLQYFEKIGFGGCLADEMGLGKSVQVIAFILSQRERKGPLTDLLVVPTSLIFHWRQEIAKFAPSLKVFVHHADSRIRSRDDFASHDLVITTYGTLLFDIALLRSFVFNYIFLDESQQIKNPESQRYKAARLLKASNKLVITGTPLENNVFDLYAQLSFACPGLLGGRKYFKDVYLRPIDQFHDAKRLLTLKEKIRPFILRRTKDEVATELPERIETVLYCEMGAGQRAIYDAYEKEFREYISATTQDELRRNSMNVLRGLTRLRQICDSPVLLGEGRLPGDASAKLDTLLSQITEKCGQHKILVFSQFVAMLDLVKQDLDKRKIGYAYLTGSIRNREQVVADFQNDPQTRVFLISLKAGGTGLNLTAADYVYLVDPWWNPAVEQQAIDRAHRIGQDKKVTAVRLVCSDTVEEKMMKLQQTKKELFQQLIQQGDGWGNGLRKDELMRLF